MQNTRKVPLTPSNESSLTDEQNSLRTPDLSEKYRKLKEGVDVPNDVFLMSETYKCIRKEIETVEYLMRVRKDVESELTARISTRD